MVRNSPYTTALMCMVLTVFAVFIATTFAASVVLRDDETGFGPIVRATPVTKSAYLFGRFAGGFLVCCLVYLSVPLGALAGGRHGLARSRDRRGRSAPSPTCTRTSSLRVPTLFVLAAGVFAFATLTRSMFATYVVALVGLLLYFLTATYVRRAEFGDLAAWFDPFGLSASGATWALDPGRAELAADPDGGSTAAESSLWLGLALGALGRHLALVQSGSARPRPSVRRRRPRDVEAARTPSRGGRGSAPWRIGGRSGGDRW